MRVLVACEFSGVVRDAFLRRGHVAMSCDLLDCEADNGLESHHNHHKGDVVHLLKSKPADYWDLMIAHPPCTYLCVSGAKVEQDAPSSSVGRS